MRESERDKGAAVGAFAFRHLTPIVGRAGDVAIAGAIGDLVAFHHRA
jgi:hypothetical protein